MLKINYDIKMNEIIKEISSQEKKPSLFLHTCCAPCCSAILEYLKKYFNISLFFYNPNITESDEYYKRYNELIEYIGKREYSITVEEGKYNPKGDFFEKIKELENEKEGGARCYKCYFLRMEETAKKAKEKGFSYFTTALSISPMKNSKWINEIGTILGERYGINYLYGDFKKRGRYKESIEISKNFNLYRQDYCGCIFSKKEREEYIKNRLQKKERNL